MIERKQCKTPGLCQCPRMKRCKGCGYTEHDKEYWQDHYLCSTTKTKKKTVSKGNSK